MLTYRHTEEYLTHLLNETTSCWIKEKDTKIRLNIYQCTELIKAKLGNNLEEKVLTLDDYSSFTWEECFEKLFGQKPEEEHKAPKDKDAAIRYAITSIYDFMLHPKKCLPYLRFLSEELGRQWKSEHDGKEFPTFDDNIIKLWAHQGNLWPIPKERYHAIKKNSLLDRLLLTKFKQYGMGETQTKWTGFVPKKTTKELLYNNTFFNENRSSINGLTHGNMHNLQRVVMLFAMEKGTIPLSYQQEDGTLGMIEPKEVFSALMRNDISLKKAPHLPLWETVLDTKLDSLTCRFTYPYDLHCMILTNEALAGTLQDYMRVSFCTHFNTMREVFNAKCETQYSNTSLCDELKKLKFEIFIHQFEETIKAETEKAQKDNLKIESDGDKWAIRYKNYKPLEYVGDFGDAIRDLCSRIDEEKREQSMARRVQG